MKDSTCESCGKAAGIILQDSHPDGSSNDGRPETTPVCAGCGAVREL